MKRFSFFIFVGAWVLFAQTVLACEIKDGFFRNELARKLFSEQARMAYRMPELPLSKPYVESILSDSRLCPRETQFDFITWDDLREKMLSPESIAEGGAYLRANRNSFAVAWNTYGVEPYVIAAILRIESHFGKEEHLGEPVLINNLYRLFYLSAGKNFLRERFAVIQLGYLLALAEKYEWQLFSPKWKSSPAGAFGIPQFIPESFWRYAVDGDGDMVINLFAHADAIVSAANYLARRGKWEQNDRGTHLPAIASYNPGSKRYLELVEEYRLRLKEYSATESRSFAY